MVPGGPITGPAPEPLPGKRPDPDAPSPDPPSLALDASASPWGGLVDGLLVEPLAPTFVTYPNRRRDSSGEMIMGGLKRRYCLLKNSSERTGKSGMSEGGGEPLGELK